MTDSHQAFIGVADVSRALGVSLSTVWRLIRRGELPTIRRHGRRLVPAAALRQRPSRRKERSVAPFRNDHPIFRLIGSGRSGGRTPGARDKHAILDT